MKYLLASLDSVLASAMLSGCAPSVSNIIMESNRQDNERAIARGKGLLAEHLKLIEKLRVEGDPMGDYQVQDQKGGVKELRSLAELGIAAIDHGNGAVGYRPKQFKETPANDGNWRTAT